ncbi:XRE family transcriptional regulator [Pseudomonas asplenii]|uniref:XRE family transcriptional regulator n=1 Tax=Pseudomonas asplenii TaxID=53407 RepID=UPI002FC2A5D5
MQMAAVVVGHTGAAPCCRWLGGGFDWRDRSQKTRSLKWLPVGFCQGGDLLGVLRFAGVFGARETPSSEPLVDGTRRLPASDRNGSDTARIIDCFFELLHEGLQNKYELQVHIMSELKVHASACEHEPMVQIEELRMAFVKRLKEALAANDLAEWGAGARLAKMAGVTPKASSKWMNGEAMPGGAKMLALANALSVRVEWLEYGRGEMRDAPPPAPAGVAEPESTYRGFDLGEDPSYSGVTQLSARAAAGSGADNSHVEIRGVLAFKSDWLRANRLNPKGLDVIYAEGDSMDPTINSGDVLLVDRSKFEPRDGQIFALQSESKGTIVKRLVKSEIDGWIIRSDNPRYRDEMLRDGEINEVRIIGRVVWRGGML